MVGLTENIQACLRDFQTGTASMARKRHLASTAGGGIRFMSYGLTGHDASHSTLLPGALAAY